jgi:hypothetical protein
VIVSAENLRRHGRTRQWKNSALSGSIGLEEVKINPSLQYRGESGSFMALLKTHGHP